MNRNSDGEYSNFCRQFFNNVPLKTYKFWIITLNDLSCATATPHPALPVPPPLPLSLSPLFGAALSPVIFRS